MSIEQEGVIDIVAEDKERGTVTLGISDHLSWDPGLGHEHVVMLQRKINAYVAFAKDGEIAERYPEYAGHQVIIKVIGAFPLTEKAKAFYANAEKILASVGIELKFEKTA